MLPCGQCLRGCDCITECCHLKLTWPKQCCLGKFKHKAYFNFNLVCAALYQHQECNSTGQGDRKPKFKSDFTTVRGKCIHTPWKTDIFYRGSI